MTLSTGQKIAIGVFVLGAAGLGIYIWHKNKKPKTPDDSVVAVATNAPASASPATKTTPVASIPQTIPPLTDVLGFQKWFNSKNFQNHFGKGAYKLVEDGTSGVLTDGAYKQTFAQYLQETGKK